VNLFTYVILVHLLVPFTYGLSRWFCAKNSKQQQNRFIIFCFLFLTLCLPFLPRLTEPLPALTPSSQTAWQEAELNFPISEAVFLPTHHSGLDFINILSWGYVLVSAFFFVRLIAQLIRIVSLPVVVSDIKVAKARIFESPHPISPFTFLNRIYLHPQLYEPESLEMILRHESVHARQWHSVDLLVVELLRIVFWCNPFIHKFTNLLKETHEYLADRDVISDGADKMKYIKLLVQASGNGPLSQLVNGLDGSLTKRRISMVIQPQIKSLSPIQLIFMPIGIALLCVAVIQTPPVMAAAPVNASQNSPESGMTFSSWPMEDGSEFRVTSHYGERLHPISKEKKHHKGIDLAAKKGTKVLATESGTVMKTGFHSDRGWFIILGHGDAYETRYYQLDRIAKHQGRDMQVGDRVQKGKTIGFVGSSGVSTGPHLHYEIRKDGTPLDPKQFLDGLQSQK